MGMYTLMSGSEQQQHEATWQVCTQPLARPSTVGFQARIHIFYLYTDNNIYPAIVVSTSQELDPYCEINLNHRIKKEKNEIKITTEAPLMSSIDTLV